MTTRSPHTDTTRPPSTAAVASVLSDDLRKRVVAALHRADGPTTRRALAADLAADGRATEAPSDPLSTEASLYHVHLPKLAELGIVRYDREAEVVELTEAGAALSTDSGLER